MIVRVLLSLVGLALIVGSIAIALESLAAAGIALAAGVAIFVLANPERFKKVNIASVLEIETRARVAVARAEETITVGRQLILAMAKLMYWQHEAHKHVGVGPVEQVRPQKIIEDLLAHSGLREEDLRDVRAIKEPFIRFRYANYVTAAVAPDNWTPQQLEAWREFNSGERRQGIGFEPSPEELRAFLEQNGFANAEVRERLADFAHWEAKKEHRRAADWDAYAIEWGD